MFNKNLLFHFLSIGLIFIVIIFYFFSVKCFTSYPWYYEGTNDSDATYSAQAVSILNGNQTHYMHHPGSTISSFHAFGYRLIGFFDNSHEKVLKLKEAKGDQDAYNILEVATRTSRIFALATLLLFVIVFYSIVYLITKRFFFSFLVTCFLFTSHWVIIHSGIVRPELPSQLFLFCAVLLTVIYFKNNGFANYKQSIKTGLAIGFFIGLALFSKVQILPLLFLYLLSVTFYLFTSPVESLSDFKDKAGKTAIGVSLINLILMPWWATKKPELLTPEYIKHSTFIVSGKEYGPYGSVPDNVLFPVLAGLVAMFLLSIGIFYFSKKKNFSFRDTIKKTTLFSFYINWIILGFILSTYLIYIPVLKFSNYIPNTNHLLYSVMTNVFYGQGFLMNNNFQLSESIKQIIEINYFSYPLGRFNILFFSIIVLLLSVIRTLSKPLRAERNYYIAVVMIIIGGIAMDFISTLRASYIMSQYPMYSLCLYILAFSLWMYVEFIRNTGKKTKILWIASRVISFVLFFCVLYNIYSIYNRPKENGKWDQDKSIQEAVTRNYVGPFWEAVSQASAIDKLKINSEKYRQIPKDTMLFKKLNISSNEAFQGGEKLRYDVHFGYINAGEVFLEVGEEEENLNGRPVWKISGKGKTNSFFDRIFSVRSMYRTYLDKQFIVPWAFARKSKEGNFKVIDCAIFDQNYNTAVNTRGITQFQGENHFQDVLSAIYYLRSCDFSGIQKNDIFPLDVYLDNDYLNLDLKYLGKEKLETGIGKINCLKFCLADLNVAFIKDPEDILIYLSDDQNKIPVRIMANILVGSLKMDLIKSSGIKNEEKDF